MWDRLPLFHATLTAADRWDQRDFAIGLVDHVIGGDVLPVDGDAAKSNQVGGLGNLRGSEINDVGRRRMIRHRDIQHIGTGRIADAGEKKDS